MDRAKAQFVLQEISKALDYSVDPTRVSLNENARIVPNINTDGYSIRMKGNFDKSTMQRIKPILERNELKIEVIKNASVVYKPHHTIIQR